MSSAVSGSSVPITTRSGRRKSSIAAPSFRNSGFDTTPTAYSVAAAIASLTLRFVPTGTVLLSTTTFGSFMTRAIPRATREHMAHVGRAVLVLRRTHGDEQDFRADDGVVEVGREGEPLFGDVPGDQLREPRLVDRNLAALEAGDLVLVDIDGDDVVPVLGKARAEHQAHVSGSKNGDLHR